MAHYIDKSAVVAEIEKRRRDWRYGSSIEAKFKREECDDILSFLDTLEVKDDVVSNDTLSNSLKISRHGDSRNGGNDDLEEAASQYPSVICHISPQWKSEVENVFKAGARWQKEQLIKDVDFEEIWKEYFKYKGDVATVNVKHLAKHFFELGLAQQNDKQK